jgi:hypothetical protein
MCITSMHAVETSRFPVFRSRIRAGLSTVYVCHCQRRHMSCSILVTYVITNVGLTINWQHRCFPDIVIKPSVERERSWSIRGGSLYESLPSSGTNRMQRIDE